MASYYEYMQRLEDERRRRARELSHAEMAQTPGMPAYAERARAGMPGGVELASMSGLPLISDAADAALTAEALEQGNWKDAAIGATALAVPFVGAPLIRKGVDWLGEKGAKGGPTIPVGTGIESEMAALGAALGPKSELSMTVHHGTPHQWLPEAGFPQGRPRMDKVGTGEGAQAYGHGIYFAENPEVAESYRRNLVDSQTRVLMDGKELEVLPPIETPGGIAIRALASDAAGPRGDINETLKYLRGVAEEKHGFDTPFVQKSKHDYRNASQWLEKMGPRLEVDRTGAKYTLDIPDEIIPGLLDWDADLGGQSSRVQEAIKRNLGYFDPSLAWGRVIRRATSNPLYGGDLAKMDKASPEQVMGALQNAGIPGLKYWDGMSRNPGEGTRNFVIWDQDLLNKMPILGAK